MSLSEEMRNTSIHNEFTYQIICILRKKIVQCLIEILDTFNYKFNVVLANRKYLTKKPRPRDFPLT